MKLSRDDIAQLKAHQLSEAEIQEQVNTIKRGTQYVQLSRPATVSDGIIRLEPGEQERYIEHYDNKRDALNIMKFVPASGAATRMFKFMYQYLETGAKLSAEPNEIQLFHKNISRFPFFDRAERDTQLDALAVKSAIQRMLDPNQLNLGQLPKGLLPFHRYPDHIQL